VIGFFNRNKNEIYLTQHSIRFSFSTVWFSPIIPMPSMWYAMMCILWTWSSSWNRMKWVIEVKRNEMETHFISSDITLTRNSCLTRRSVILYNVLCNTKEYIIYTHGSFQRFPFLLNLQKYKSTRVGGHVRIWISNWLRCMQKIYITGTWIRVYMGAMLNSNENVIYADKSMD